MDMDSNYVKKIIKMLFALLVCVMVFTSTVSAVAYTDDLGRTVEIPETVSHIIPSGSLAQTVLTSFNPSYLVSLCSSYDEDAGKYVDASLLTLPNTGSQFGSKRTMTDEEIMKLSKEINVDIILDMGEVKDNMGDDMDQLQFVTGVPFLFITQATISDIPESYRKLGILIGAEERGNEIAEYAQSIIDRFNNGMAKVDEDKVSMIYVTQIDGNSVYMIGSGKKSAYHTNVIDKVAINVAPEAISGGGSGNEFSMEEILKLDPDYIIVNASGNNEHIYYDKIMNDSQWATLRAVQNNNVYEAPINVPYNWMGQPPSSVNKLVSMIWLGKIFYPNTFSYDLKSEIQKFYNVMFNYTMTDSEYEKLTKCAKGNNTATSTPFPIIGVLIGIGTAACVFAKRRF